MQINKNLNDEDNNIINENINNSNIIKHIKHNNNKY